MVDLSIINLSSEKREKLRQRKFGENVIKMAMSACAVASGNGETFKAFEEEIKKAGLNFKVEQTACFGTCFAEPFVKIQTKGNSYYYYHVKKEMVPEMVAKLKRGEIPEKNLYTKEDEFDKSEYFKKQVRLVSKNCGIIDPESLDDYLIYDGYQGLKKAYSLKPEEVISVLREARLRGRGGAGFPTATKWEFLRSNQSEEKYLIANADEGDPGAFMNRALLERDPFRLIEGMTIASYATGTSEGFIYARAEYPLVIQRLKNALKIARENGLLGKNILGTSHSFDIHLCEGAGAFVCGEETALMNSIEGKRGMPRPRPPFPAQKGLFSKPTNINNVETYSHVTTIFQSGVEDYKKYGTEKTGGTKMICLTGKIKRPGVVEVPFGIMLRELIFDIGGGCDSGFKAVQVGGPSGGCIPESELDVELDYETIVEKGAIMGSGGFVVMDKETDMVDVAKFFTSFTRDESCGKCTPCREGMYRMWEMLERITNGEGKKGDIEKLEKLGNVIMDTALCGLGQTAPKPVLSTIRYFRKEYEDYIEGKKSSFPTYKITDKCIGCTKCAKICPVSAITGKIKEKHEINQNKCIHCGACYTNCPVKAIEKK